MYVYCHDRFAEAKYSMQADLEESLFGGGQEEVVEFGADQCKHFVCDGLFCPNLSDQVYSCAMTPQGIGFSSGSGTVLSCQFFRPRVGYLPNPSSQDPLREQGPRVQRCQSQFSLHFLITDETKVLLYNFFGDSTATLNQWRLVLNGVTNVDNLSDAPAFDETRHASICIEVRYPWRKLSFPF